MRQASGKKDQVGWTHSYLALVIQAVHGSCGPVAERCGDDEHALDHTGHARVLVMPRLVKVHQQRRNCTPYRAEGGQVADEQKGALLAQRVVAIPAAAAAELVPTHAVDHQQCQRGTHARQVVDGRRLGGQRET